jgi:hypothetical protein
MDSSNLQSWAFGGSSDAWSDKRVEAGFIPGGTQVHVPIDSTTPNLM